MNIFGIYKPYVYRISMLDQYMCLKRFVVALGKVKSSSQKSRMHLRVS